MRASFFGEQGDTRWNQRRLLSSCEHFEHHELDVIAAVVIGGGSLSGGEGSIFGSLAGALIMVGLRDGLKAIGAGNAWQDILIGAIIIVAVLADQLQRRKER